jgi:hypothetical protein
VIGIVTSHGQEGLQATLSPQLRLFIRAAQRTPYRGFAHRGFAWQQLNHSALRRFHGLDPNSPGILVRRILGGGTGSRQLKKGDILLKLGEHVIDPEGHIVHPVYGPILFTIAMNESLADTIPATILRDGHRTEVELTRQLFSPEDYRIHPYLFDQAIDFEMFGGLVVQELSLGYLRQWGQNWQNKAPARLVMEYFLNSLREEGELPEKVLIVSRVLPDPSNIGYDGVRNSILRTVNGVDLRSLQGFRAAVRRPQGGFHVLELNPGSGRGRLVFKASEIERANRRVRERYGIPARKRRLTATAR